MTYLTLNEARTFLTTAAERWLPHDNEANNEGWSIFNLMDEGDSLDAGIEHYNDPGMFDCDNPIDFNGDEAVVEHCRRKAAEGSPCHTLALEIEHALNSLRFHLWGPDWVDSRMGPQTYG